MRIHFVGGLGVLSVLFGCQSLSPSSQSHEENQALRQEAAKREDKIRFQRILDEQEQIKRQLEAARQLHSSEAVKPPAQNTEDDPELARLKQWTPEDEERRRVWELEVNLREEKHRDSEYAEHKRKEAAEQAQEDEEDIQMLKRGTFRVGMRTSIVGQYYGSPKYRNSTVVDDTYFETWFYGLNLTLGFENGRLRVISQSR